MQSAVIGHYLDTDLQNAELNVKNISFIAGPKAPPETAVQEYTVDDLQVVHLVRGKKELLLAGVPEHLQQLDGHQPWLQEVTEKWFQRLGRTAVAVLEGGLRPDIERQKLDLEAAVARHAEPGLLAALALKHHARPWDAEPPADGLWDLLAFKDQHPELGIKKDDIVAFFGLRGIPQWCRLRDQGIYIPLEKYLPTLIWERCGKHMTYKDLVAVGRKRLGDFGGDKFFSGDELVLDDDDAAKYFMAQTTGFNLPTKELRSVLQHIAAANEASRFQSFAGQLHTLWRQELSSLFVTHKVYSGLIAKAVKSFAEDDGRPPQPLLPVSF